MTDWPEVHDNDSAQLKMHIGGATHHNSTKVTRFMSLLGCAQTWCTTCQYCFLIKSRLAAAAARVQGGNVQICMDLWPI